MKMSMLVLMELQRVELERPGEKPDVLLQPVLIGPDVKKRLQAGGYLR